MDFILNSLENRTSLSVRKISIPYPFAAEQELLVPVFEVFFRLLGAKTGSIRSGFS